MNEPSHPVKILTIDASPERQQSYQRLLDGVPDRQFIVVAADTADKGLSLNQTFRPDCILVSAELPDMDAAAFISALGNDPERPQVGVVMTASADGERNALQVLGRGAHDFIVIDGLSAAQVQRAVFNAMEFVSLRNQLADARKEIDLFDLNDPLTQLASRSLLYDRLTHAVILAKRNNASVCLLVLEMDQFKEVSLIKGHEAGNAGLREIGQRLTGNLRKADTCARMSGEQLAVIMETGATFEGAVITAQKLVNIMREPFSCDEGPVDLSLNVGITLFPNHAEDADTLLHHAESAMVQAREQGGGFVMFTHDDAALEYAPRNSAA
jgi:diguanylate cyclase (GGDEF)-like protein